MRANSWYFLNSRCARFALSTNVAARSRQIQTTAIENDSASKANELISNRLQVPATNFNCSSVGKATRLSRYRRACCVIRIYFEIFNWTISGILKLSTGDKFQSLFFTPETSAWKGLWILITNESSNNQKKNNVFAPVRRVSPGERNWCRRQISWCVELIWLFENARRSLVIDVLKFQHCFLRQTILQNFSKLINVRKKNCKAVTGAARIASGSHANGNHAFALETALKRFCPHL